MLVHAMTRTDLENTRLSDVSQSGKAAECVVLLAQMSTRGKSADTGID